MRFLTNRTMTLAALALLLAALCLAPNQGSAEVIDRIVATVNGQVILQSDWDEALCYEACSPTELSRSSLTMIVVLFWTVLSTWSFFAGK